MAWTSTNFYMTTLFVVITVFVSLGLIGTSLVSNDRIDLNEDSIDYILELKGVSKDSGFENVSNNSASNSNIKDVLDNDDQQQVSDSNDFLSTLFIKKERANEPTNLFYLVYNIPTSMIKGLGLPIDAFTHLINIISLFLFVSLIILVWTRWIRT